MIRYTSILFLICYGLLLSGSMLSVGHELLHATSSITGIHQHEVKQHAHVHNTHSHHHHVSDHGSIFQDVFTPSAANKKLFTNMVFLAFYYESVIQYDFSIFLKVEVKYIAYQQMLNNFQLAPNTPPPDYFNS